MNASEYVRGVGAVEAPTATVALPAGSVGVSAALRVTPGIDRPCALPKHFFVKLGDWWMVRAGEHQTAGRAAEALSCERSAVYWWRRGEAW